MPAATTPLLPAGHQRPLLTVDVVIFSVRDEVLQLLLVHRPSTPGEPYPGRWALPGGFVDMQQDASLLACARRKLLDKTGVLTPYLEQLGSWGDARRDPRGWCATCAYFALIPWPQAGGDGAASLSAPGWTSPGAPAAGPPAAPAPPRAESAWWPADDALRKRLAFDHAEILAAALERLRGKVEYTSLPAFLLDEPFTLPELQRVYEVVLGRPLDKSAFRKRMLDAGFLEEAGKVGGAFGRAAMGYRVLDRERAAVFPRTFRSGE
jgi:8-oxo-dGTP diphosphatase